MDFVIATKVEFENNANIFVEGKLRFNDVNVKYISLMEMMLENFYSNYFRAHRNFRFVDRSFFCLAKLKDSLLRLN